MRVRRLAISSFGMASGALGFWVAGCGQAFTLAPDGGGSDRRTPRDVAVPDGGAESAPPEAGPRPEAGSHDASPEASSCRGLVGSVMTDSNNCGGCGHSCGSEKCVKGHCPIATVASGLTNPDGIAVDSLDDVFFSTLGNCSGTGTSVACADGGVLRRDHDGGGAPSVALQTGLASSAYGLPLAADPINAYWLVTAPSPAASPGVASPIESEALSGGPVAPFPPPSGITNPFGILAVDPTYLFVAETGGTLYGAAHSAFLPALAIANVGEVVAGISVLGLPSSEYVFWANRSGSVMGATIAANVATPLKATLTGLTPPTGIASSKHGVYWVDGTNVVHTADLALAASDALATVDVALQATRIVSDSGGGVYWTDHDQGTPSNGSVMALYHDAKSPIELAGGLLNPTALAISATRVYWVNSGTPGMSDGSIMSTRR